MRTLCNSALASVLATAWAQMSVPVIHVEPHDGGGSDGSVAHSTVNLQHLDHLLLDPGSPARLGASLHRRRVYEKVAPQDVDCVDFAGHLMSRKLTPVTAMFQYGTPYSCLLYTSDAADEEDSVDLGGRRIIKKKKIMWLMIRPPYDTQS
eukprot:TRINITY_DN36383_c0_g1_i3.p1 TRINITY_DN36383_c0_g1~~TRINITY_DN36383_c0_g1_i3.p1  ORF type:complete len:150 (+),score=15.91 TRINITY_DN36383_c0_g1_i3:641-1090(+)